MRNYSAQNCVHVALYRQEQEQIGNIRGLKYFVTIVLYRYIFSLASNPFYLWLICTIFYEAGEGYVPTTLTQLYTWVMLVFSNQWQHTEDKLNLDADTVEFLKG